MTTPYVWPPTIELRRDPVSVARHLDALRAVLRLEPAPSRGVVWVGGGRYWPGIVVGVRMLRESGCALPVEVWHRGECEPVNPADVAGLGVEIVDADSLAATRGDNRVPRGEASRGGWEGKLYALTRSRFDQILYLDADAYPVADPAPLFEGLTPHAPFLFWEDLPATRDSVAWDRVLPDADRTTPTVQGGQLLIDRRNAGRLLAAAHWMCQHSDFYFAHVYGDQDCWRVGLGALVSGYRCLGPADWLAPAFVCRLGAKPYIVHRCQSKLFAGTDPLRNDSLPGESRVFDLFREVTAGRGDK